MSYDIRWYLETKARNCDGDNHVLVHRPRLDSPTYNLRDMFVACMDWDFEQGTYYPLTYVLGRVRHGIKELTEHREDYERYNPPNGWGDLDGALEGLRSWEAEMTYDAGGTVTGFDECWDAHDVIEMWGMENLWWRW